MMRAPADLRNASTSVVKSLASDALNSPVAIPPMPDYNGRLLAYTSAAVIIGVGVLQGAFQEWNLWLIGCVKRIPPGTDLYWRINRGPTCSSGSVLRQGLISRPPRRVYRAQTVRLCGLQRFSRSVNSVSTQCS